MCYEQVLTTSTSCDISYIGMALDIEVTREQNIIGSIPVLDTFFN